MGFKYVRQLKLLGLTFGPPGAWRNKALDSSGLHSDSGQDHAAKTSKVVVYIS